MGESFPMSMFCIPQDACEISGNRIYNSCKNFPADFSYFGFFGLMH